MAEVDYNKKRWGVLIAVCIVNLIIGTGFAWSVYQAALIANCVEIFGVELAPAQIALTFTIHTAVAPICMVAGTALNPKLGPKKVIIGGAIMFCGGLIISSFVSSIGVLYATYGVIAGLGVSTAYGVTTQTAVSWFPDKGGLASGIATCAYGFGSVIFPPVIQAFINAGGPQFAMRWTGVIYFIVIVVASTFIKSPPKGWLPTGFTPKAPVGGGPAIVNKDWKQMLADIRFWIMLIIFTCFATAGLMVVSQGKTMAIDPVLGGLDPVAQASLATLTVSFIGIANSIGRLFWGAVSDKIGRYPALIVMTIIVAACGFGLSMVKSSYVPFLILAMLFALCYGGSMGVYPAMVAGTFGPKNMGVNYGIVFTGFAAGGYIGPILATSLKASSGGYQLPMQVVGCLGILACVLVFVLTVLQKNAAKKAAAEAAKAE